MQGSDVPNGAIEKNVNPKKSSFIRFVIPVSLLLVLVALFFVFKQYNLNLFSSFSSKDALDIDSNSNYTPESPFGHYLEPQNMTVDEFLLDKYSLEEISELIPENPEFSYVPEDLHSISQMEWEVHFYRPVVLEAYSEGNAHYIKAAFIDIDKSIKTINVFLGGNVYNKEIDLVRVGLDYNDYIQPDSLQYFEETFKEGDQILVAFLKGVSEDFNSFDNTEFCETSERMCSVAELTVSKDFSGLPAVFLSRFLDIE